MASRDWIGTGTGWSAEVTRPMGRGAFAPGENARNPGAESAPPIPMHHRSSVPTSRTPALRLERTPPCTRVNPFL